MVLILWTATARARRILGALQGVPKHRCCLGDVTEPGVLCVRVSAHFPFAGLIRLASALMHDARGLHPGWEESLARPHIKTFRPASFTVYSPPRTCSSPPTALVGLAVQAVSSSPRLTMEGNWVTSGYFAGVVAGRDGSAAIRGQTLECRELESTSM
jgi:hypothetical protein